jgi:hypothetical protein
VLSGYKEEFSRQETDTGGSLVKKSCRLFKSLACISVKKEVIQNHDNENVRNIGQGKARHRKYKRLKLGGGQAYDRSSD